jgi:hypothetical protein
MEHRTSIQRWRRIEETCLPGNLVPSRAALKLYLPTLAADLDDRTGILDHEDPYI